MVLPKCEPRPAARLGVGVSHRDDLGVRQVSKWGGETEAERDALLASGSGRVLGPVWWGLSGSLLCEVGPVCGGLGTLLSQRRRVDDRVMTLDLMCPNCGEVIHVPDANQPVGYLQSYGQHGRPPSLHMHGGGALLHECVLTDDHQAGPAPLSGATRSEGG